MTKMKYLCMSLAIVGMLAPSIQSNVYAEQGGKDRKSTVQPQIAGGQFACSFDFIGAVDDGIPVATGTVASISNSVTRNVILQFSAEAAVSAAGTTMNLYYSIDGGAPIVIGPEFYAVNSGAFETKTHIGVITLPAGFHTIEPFIAVFGPGGTSGGVFFRCLTAEGKTK